MKRFINKLYWLNNKNDLIQVEGHYELFQNRLLKRYGQQEYYDMLVKQGFLRLVHSKDGIIVCFNQFNNVTDSKRSFLKNYCIENKVKLFEEINPAIQRVGFQLREIDLS